MCVCVCVCVCVLKEREKERGREFVCVCVYTFMLRGTFIFLYGPLIRAFALVTLMLFTTQHFYQVRFFISFGRTNQAKQTFDNKGDNYTSLHSFYQLRLLNIFERFDMEIFWFWLHRIAKNKKTISIFARHLLAFWLAKFSKFSYQMNSIVKIQSSFTSWFLT